MRTTLELTRVWAALTGLAVVALAFMLLAFGYRLNGMLPMLATSIAGFELFLFAQDVVSKRWRRRG